MNSVSGNITIQGNSTSGFGVEIDTSTLSANAGGVSIIGTSTAGGSSAGAAISRSNISSQNGAISVIGTFAANAIAGRGLLIDHNVAIASSGNGSITLQGTGANADFSEGFYGAGNNITVSSGGGNIAILGQSSANNSTALFLGGSGIQIVAPASGANITLQATAGASSGTALVLGNAVIGSATNTGTVTLRADSMSSAGANISGAGTLVIEPVTSSTTIGLGSGASGLQTTPRTGMLFFSRATEMAEPRRPWRNS